MFYPLVIKKSSLLRFTRIEIPIPIAGFGPEVTGLELIFSCCKYLLFNS